MAATFPSSRSCTSPSRKSSGPFEAPGGCAETPWIEGINLIQNRHPQWNGSMSDPDSSPGLRPREIKEILAARPTIEGAGVQLHRAFGAAEVPRLDPFLLLDDFRSENPAEYVAGFPWHPHRGIETVTYMLDGRVEHEDSLGNKGIIGSGDVQWMTSGSGIIHQEMPKVDQHRMGGFQLWVNLPQTDKMMDPRYREVKAGQIPEVEPGRGVRMRVVAGKVKGDRRAVHDAGVGPQDLDIRLGSRTDFLPPVNLDHTAFLYLLQRRA